MALTTRFDKILNRLIERYVKTTGDTMTGALRMDSDVPIYLENTGTVGDEAIRYSTAHAGLLWGGLSTSRVDISVPIGLGIYANTANDATGTFEPLIYLNADGSASIEGKLQGDAADRILTLDFTSGVNIPLGKLQIADSDADEETIPISFKPTSYAAVNLYQRFGRLTFGTGSGTTNRIMDMTLVSGSGELSVHGAAALVTPNVTGGVPKMGVIKNSGTTEYRWDMYMSGMSVNVQTITASSDTLVITDNVNLCDCSSNAITINLPTAAGSSNNKGKVFHIKKIDSTSNTVTVDPNGSETIDGQATKVISSQYDSMMIVSDGSNWHII